MTVASVTERLALMWANIDGIRTPFKQVPRVILGAQVPAVVIFPGEAQYNLTTLSEQIVVEHRTYDMVLFYAPALFGTATQQQIGIEPFFTTVRDYFLARPGLTLDGADPPQNVVYDAKILGDSGFQLVDYASGESEITSFAAIRFRIRVDETAQVLYKD